MQKLSPIVMVMFMAALSGCSGGFTGNPLNALPPSWTGAFNWPPPEPTPTERAIQKSEEEAAQRRAAAAAAPNVTNNVVSPSPVRAVPPTKPATVALPPELPPEPPSTASATIPATAPVTPTATPAPSPSPEIRPETSPEARRDALLTKAKAGDAAAQLQLGDLYAYGAPGIAADASQARFWYGAAASNGNAAGHAGLGRMYYAGIGGAVDLAKAEDEFTRAQTLSPTNAVERQLARTRTMRATPSLLSGQSLADANTLRDAAPLAIGRARELLQKQGKECEGPQAATAAVSESRLLAPFTDADRPGEVTWEEEWTVVLCGQRVPVRLHFTQDEDRTTPAKVSGR